MIRKSKQYEPVSNFFFRIEIGSGFYLLVSDSGFIMKFPIRIRIRAGQNNGPPKKEKGKKILFEEPFESFSRA
jgi:hypothetical protein